MFNKRLENKVLKSDISNEGLEKTIKSQKNILKKLQKSLCEKHRPIKVLFLLPEISLWDVYRPIYKKMISSPFFDPHVVAFQRTDIIAEKTEEEFVCLLKKLSINFTFMSQRDGSLPPLDDFLPDIIFYTLGTLAYPIEYRIELISNHYLTCYLSYGFLLVNEPEYQFGQSFHHSAWTVFASTKREELAYEDRTHRLISNVHVVGYPKFDLYPKLIPSPPKRPCIIWAPHWTIDDVYPALNLGMFHEIYKSMRDFMKERKDIDFIFKPHPNMRYACKKTGLMSEDIYDDYLRELSSEKNIKIDNNGNNIEDFIKSTAMITDSVSFLAEYLPSGRPLLFLNRPDRAIFSDTGEAIIASHYAGKNMDDIVNFIKEVISDYDPKKNKRSEALISELNIQKNGTSKQVMDHIKRQLKISKMNMVFSFFKKIKNSLNIT